MKGSIVDTETALARDAILKVARAHPETRWTAYQLKAAARNGGDHGALGLALDDLLADHTLKRDPRDRLIRLPA